MKVIAPEESYYRQPHYCKTCGEATKDQKPYCREHITETPYAQKLLKEIKKEARKKKPKSKAKR